MKKNFKYALMSAIAVVGAVSFSACSSNEEIVDNPDYDPETNSVKTEFAININHPSARTRMATENTQSDGSFKGMNNMFLFSLASAPADATSFIAAGKFDLGSLASSEIAAEKSSKVYTMYIPVSTSNFLFYGKNNITGATAAQKGSLTYNVTTAATKPSEISFSLNPVVASGDVETNVTAPEGTLASYMNNIENTTGWAESVAQTATDASYTALSNAYTTFTSLANRQGSSVAILRQVQDIYRVMYEVANTTSNPNAVKTIANAVINNITGSGKGFTVKSETSGTSAELQFTSTDPLVTNFPEQIGIPAGSAVLTYNSSATAGSRFSYTSFKTSAIFGETPSNDMGNINTPAELVYFDNSPLRASDQSLTEADFAIRSTTDTPNAWETDANWASTKGWTDNATVSNSTRAVAMKYNIKYGVALLKTTVTLREANLTDNASQITNGITENQADIDGTKLQLTGIIIGGQPTSADWQFLPSSTSLFNQTVYDPIAPVVLSTSSATAPNYTLLLDNYNAEAADVNVALEFKNNGKDFYGKDGLIASGQKFYLVGALKVNDGTGDLTWPLGIPQSEQKRVFIQDFMTEANFTIDNGSDSLSRKPSLQNAYSVIPDLRSTQMLFGLSVDLTWKSGLKFNIDL